MASYGTTAGVQALVPALSPITTLTVPTTAQVTAWLEEGASKINRAISGAGYAYPVVATADLHGTLTALNNLYAAAYAIRARGMDTATGGEASRDVIWLREFAEELSMLVRGDLTASGATLLLITTRPYRSGVRSMQLRKVDGYARPLHEHFNEYTTGEYTSE